MSIKNHDEWMIAFSIDREREYLIHNLHPRFIARHVECDDNGEPLDSADNDADFISGITIALNNGGMLCGIYWLDDSEIDEETLIKIQKNAQAAIDNFDKSN